MDVRVLIAAVVVLTMWRHASAQNTPVDASNITTTTTTTSEPAQECLTARNVSGVCTQRNSCDYNTGAIDLTLYAPHDYQRPCAVGEVCCPYFAIIQAETTPTPVESDSDEDDD